MPLTWALSLKMKPREYTEEFEVENANFGRPHIVLLGAGAIYAAFPNGDRNGRKLPLLRDFVAVIGLENEMEKANMEPPFDDFEAIYSEIQSNKDLLAVKESIDSKVVDYFSSMELPDEPTLYDHLVLSLRPKDVVATFNWDPFLWNALHRNHKFTNGPCALFLHGSVAISRCPNCEIVVSRSSACCHKCGGLHEEIPILFPVTRKDYVSDPAIAGHWRTLKRAMKEAWAFTVFGYSAPKTDVEAIQLLKEGWGNASDRNLEQIEIIDILDEDTLLNSWNEFIHSHHYTVFDNFYSCFIGEHPRRSCEAYWNQNMECMFIEPFPMPKGVSFDQLYEWVQPRVDAEKKR